LRNFFPTVQSEQVRDVLENYLFRVLHRSDNGIQLPLDIIEELTEVIIQLTSFEGRLPQ